MSMAVSTAKVEITPTLTMNPYMGGYGAQSTTPRQATGTRTPLYARCVVLWDSGYPNVLVTADVLGFPRSMHQSIRQRVGQLWTGWPSPYPCFMLSATHNHSGPALVDELEPYCAYNLTDTTQLQSYSTWLGDQIVALVQTALAASKTTVTLDYQVASQTWSYNREGLAYAETAVPILVARNSGHVVAVLFSYGCHPVTAGGQTLWDSDFAGGACTAIESAIPGSFAMFIQGPAGDQDPAGTRGWTLRDQLSAQLGQVVATAAAHRGRALTGPIATDYQEVVLPLDITPTPANLAAVRACYVTRQTEAGLPGWYARHATRMIAQIDAGTFVTTVPLPYQTWQFQGAPVLKLLLTGGEPVSGYAVYFRGQWGGTNALWMGGYGNELPGYLPSNELLPPLRANGSYAGGWDTDFPGIAGGSQTVYAYLAHYLAGTGGIESTLISALNAT